MRIETERLIIRSIEEKDSDSIWEASRCPGLTDGMYWNPPKTKKALLKQISEEKIGKHWFPLVIANKDDILLGRLFLTNRGEDWEIGYWLLPKNRGRGYAFEAVKAMIDYAFTELSAREIIASSCLWNKKSSSLLLKIGFSSQGMNDNGLKKNGREYPVENFSLSKKAFSRFSKKVPTLVLDNAFGVGKLTVAHRLT